MRTITDLLDQLLRVTSLLQADMASSLEVDGLTPARAHLLWALREMGPSTQQSLAVALAVTPRNITGLVDALVSKGFVERASHPNDRRATLVTLTPVGGAAVEAMAEGRERLGSQIFGQLSASRRRALGRELDELSASLERLTREARVDPAATG